MGRGAYIRTFVVNGPAVALAVCLLAPLPTTAQEYRTYDGFGNNLSNPTWGMGSGPMVRLFPSKYGDGVSSFGGQDRPNPRAISNAVCSQTAPRFSSRVLTNMVMQWGQWVDHDLDFRKRQQPSEFVNIPIPIGDPHFDPQGTGTAKIFFTRSRWLPGTGTGPSNPREQINAISSFMDCNTVYGSNQLRADLCRSFRGGRLLMSPGDYLPWNTFGEEMDFPPQGVPQTELMLAGDDRANEQVGLLSMHVLWAREHNRLCDELAAANPGWDDERLYQEARNIVIALNQAITYNAFLPALLGPGAIPPYSGYQPRVNPGVSNEFAHAAFRFAHSMLNPTLARLNEDGTPIPEGNIALRDAFFVPHTVIDEGGIDPILRGLCAQGSQEIDHLIIDDVRNFLFGPPGIFGLDLAALNIHRGRDHGLPTLNEARLGLGLAPYTSFEQISSDPETTTRLASIYASVDQVDLWLGGICEDQVPGAGVGPVFRAIIADTFRRVRDGDRFWYQNRMFTPKMLAAIEATTLADVIKRNTSIVRIQSDVFRVWPDFNNDQTLNLADFGSFQTRFAMGDMEADFDRNGVLDLQDFLLFSAAYQSFF